MPGQRQTSKTVELNVNGVFSVLIDDHKTESEQEDAGSLLIVCVMNSVFCRLINFLNMFPKVLFLLANINSSVS